jgi:hypothetical protein
MPQDMAFFHACPNAQTIVVVDDQGRCAIRDGADASPQGVQRDRCAGRRRRDSHDRVAQGARSISSSRCGDAGIGGRELYEYLSERHPEMKVLFVSGYTADAFEGRTVSGAFLAKPFLLDTLAKRVHEILDTESRLAAYAPRCLVPRPYLRVLFVAMSHSAQSPSATLAPTGTLRAVFLGTNPVHGRVDPQTGTRQVRFPISSKSSRRSYRRPVHSDAGTRRRLV